MNQKSNVSAAKCTRLASSAGTDVVHGAYIPATPDDDDVCEVEWDSPRPLSGNICYCHVTFILVWESAPYNFVASFLAM